MTIERWDVPWCRRIRRTNRQDESYRRFRNFSKDLKSQ